MKTLFLAGGFAGFLICATAGVLAGHTPGLIFRDAAIGCLISALLARWFWSVLVTVFAETLAVRRKAAAEAAQAAQAAAQGAQAAAQGAQAAAAAKGNVGPAANPAANRPPTSARPHLVTTLRPSSQASR